MSKTWMTEYGAIGGGWEGAFTADLRRHYEVLEGTHWQRVFRCIGEPGVQAMAVLRFGQWALGQPRWFGALLDPVYGFANACIRICWGIDLSRHASIGPGLRIAHFSGVTVMPYVSLGRNCTLSTSVTIGAADERVADAPVIGDNVFIGPGARLLGRIRVGSNSRIGANAVVSSDVPDNAVVAFDPGFRTGEAPREQASL
jgi:serine O-acetyltransferase